MTSTKFPETLAWTEDITEPLHPDLMEWVEEEGPLGGPMLRHPLVYDMFLGFPGLTNRAYAQKREMLAEAEARKDWHSCVFLHERAYRLKALIDYVTGRDDEGEVLALAPGTPQDVLDLVADVWVDSENIAQVNDDWRALIAQPGEMPAVWLGTAEEREQFDALPEVYPGHVKMWRGGAVGDWSWTTDIKVAEFFSRLSGHPIRGYNIPRADVFGYLTRRQEAEALVRHTPFRARLVYPDGE